MSTEQQTEQYPEVSAEDAGLVPPQSAPKQEWPKKLRTLSATDLDRLTIDGLGRFYWDGKLVNYFEGQPSPPKPIDYDQHALDLLDRAARELADPNSVQPSEPGPQLPPLPVAPSDSLAPAVATGVTTPGTLVDVRNPGFMVASPVRSDVIRFKLTLPQLIGAAVLVASLALAAVSLAMSTYVAMSEWNCKIGAAKSGCPAAPAAPQPPPRPDIPA